MNDFNPHGSMMSQKERVNALLYLVLIGAVFMLSCGVLGVIFYAKFVELERERVRAKQETRKATSRGNYSRDLREDGCW